MNIVFVVPYVPTPVRTRPYNLLRSLVRRGHSLTLATLWQSESELHSLRQLEHDGVRVLAEPLTTGRAARNDVRALFSASPLQAAHCWQSTLATRLHVLVAKSHSAGSNGIDILHVEHLRGARYGLMLKSVVPTVWDSVDCISYLFEQASRYSAGRLARWMACFELRRTQRYEGWLVHQFDRVLVTSATDRTALERLACSGSYRSTDQPQPRPCHHESIAVLPNGVDLEYFRAGDAPRRTDTLVLSGKMSYHANVTAALYFAHKVLPLIWCERPQVQLWIVGQAPPAAVRALTADPRITVTGYVPDLRRYVSQATVAVCPLVYGAGIQNKVLEAMACATPVVAGSVGLSALKAKAGEEMLVADTPQEFARHVLRLLSDPESAYRMGLASRRFVERHHDWAQIANQLEANYQETIEAWNGHRLQTLR